MLVLVATAFKLQISNLSTKETLIMYILFQSGICSIFECKGEYKSLIHKLSAAKNKLLHGFETLQEFIDSLIISTLYNENDKMTVI